MKDKKKENGVRVLGPRENYLVEISFSIQNENETTVGLIFIRLKTVVQ